MNWVFFVLLLIEHHNIGWALKKVTFFCLKRAVSPLHFNTCRFVSFFSVFLSVYFIKCTKPVQSEQPLAPPADNVITELEFLVDLPM